MANTVTLLNYANTFGDWVVTTNKLAQENNDLAANNYVKPTGTLYLNSPTLGLQVANNAVVQGQFQVSGIGSSAYIQKNLQVDGSIIGSGNNSFVVNDSNAVFSITQFGNGAILRINPSFGSNSAIIDTNGNVYIGSAAAGPFKLNVANGNVNFANNLTVGSNVSSQIVRTSNHLVSKDITSSANVLGDKIQANTNLTSPTLTVSGTSYIEYVQANTSVNTSFLTATTGIISSLNVTNNLTVGSNVSSQIVRTSNHLVSKDITSSANVLGDKIQANTNLTSPTLTVSGTSYIEYVQANTSINTSVLTATTGSISSLNVNAFNVNTQQANTINATNITATTIITPVLNVTSNINSFSGDLRINNIFANTTTLVGDFIIQGEIVYSTDILTLNSGTVYAANARFAVDRGIGNANAQLKWNESNFYWEINDVNNPSSYSKILTANLISDSTNSTSSSTLASSKAANTLNGNISALQTQMSTTNTSVSAVNTFSRMVSFTANAAYGKANAEGSINTTQNTWITNTDTLATAAYGKANAEGSINTTQNTWITNTDTLATAAYGKANAEGSINTTQNTWITNTDTLATAAYGKANAEGSINTTQNTNITNVNTLATAAYGKANAEGSINTTQNTNITNVNTLATAAYGRANTGVTSVGGTSPVSSSGGLTPTISLASGYGDTQNPYASKTANFFLASPNASSGTPSFRAIVAADIPTLNQNTTGTANNITAYTINQSVGTTNSVQFNSLGVGTAASGTAGEIRATNNITAYYSDDRLKTKLGNIENALQKITKLNGFYYEANEVAQALGYSVKKEVGVSAQEIQQVLPEIIAPAPIDDKYLTVHYERIIPLLIEAIKELKQEVDNLKGDNK